MDQFPAVNNRTFTIQINLAADTTGGTEAAAVLERLQQKSAEAGVSLDEFLGSVGNMPGDAGKHLEDVGDGLQEVAGSTTEIGKANPKDILHALRTGINGLMSGDPARALGGVASGLARLTTALPSAAVAGTAAAATLAIVKIIDNLIEASKAPLNELGETVEEEMARLKAIGAKEFEWQGAMKSFDEIDQRMSASQKSADSLRASLNAIFKSKEDARIENMESQAALAEASGDTEKADAIRHQIERVKLSKEAVSTIVEIETKEAEDIANEAGIKASKAALIEIEKKASETSQRLAEIVALFEKVGLKGRELEPGSEQIELIRSLTQDRMEYGRDNRWKFDYNSPALGRPRQVAWGLMRSGQLEDVADADALLNAIREYKTIKDADKKHSAAAAQKRDEYTSSYADLEDSTPMLRSHIKTLEDRLNSIFAKLNETEIAAAQAAAFRQIEAIADAIDRGIDDSGTDPEQIWENAQASIDSFSNATITVADAIAEFKRLTDDIYAAETGTDLSPLFEKAQQLRDIIDAFGTVEQQTSIGTPADIRANLQQLWELRGDLEEGANEVAEGAMAAQQQTRAALSSLGSTYAAGGEKFAEVAAGVESKTATGMSNFNSAANSMATAAGYFSASAETILRNMAQVLNIAIAAERKADEAMQQIRAMR